MAFVQPSDFTIPNTRFVIPNITAGPGTFSAFIEEREAYILRVVFGSKFYKEFVDALAALPALWLQATAYVTGNQVTYGVSIWEALQDNNGVVPVEGADWTKVEDNKYLKLRDGFTYEHCEKEYRYGGIKEVLIPYIYSEYIKKNYLNVAKLGVNQPKVENSAVVHPMFHIVSTYNEFVRLLGKTVFGYNSIDTLYGFYWANRADYEDLRFDEQCKVQPANTMGI